jgi:hypothetical protein
MRKLLLAIALLVPALAFAQSAPRYDSVVQSPTGQAIAGASIAVCTQPATTTTTPCSPLATLYPDSSGTTYTISSIARSGNVVTVTTSVANTVPVGQWVTLAGVTDPSFDGTFETTAQSGSTFQFAQVGTNGSSSGGTVAGANPTFSDGLGNYHFYAAYGSGTQYTVQIYGQNVTTQIKPDQVYGTSANAPGLAQNNAWSGNETHSGTEAFSGNTTINGGQNQGTFYSLNDVVYVDCQKYECSPDINVGIQAAANSLPSCPSGGSPSTYDHCGYVILPAGSYNAETADSFDGPVHILGQGKNATFISQTFTGTAYTFTASPFNGDQSNNQAQSWGFSELSDLKLDGTSAGAGSIPLEAHDMTGFEAHDLGLQNYSGAGDVCFYETAASPSVPLERFNVDIETDNCTLGWSDYFPSPGGGSSGYGHHRLMINPKSGSSQVGIKFNGAGIQEDDLDVIINAPSDATGIELVNNSAASADHGLIHIEGAATGITTDATSDYVIANVTDIENTTTPYSFNASSYAEFLSNGLSYAYGLGIQPINRGITWYLGNPSNCAFTNAVSEICVPTGFSTSVPMFGIDVGAEGGLFQIESDGSIYDRPASTLRHYVFQDISNPSTIPVAATIASGTATMTTVGITSGSCGTTVSISAPGVLTTDVISWAYNASTSSLLIVNRWPTANAVNFEYCNPTAGTITPSAATINWRVGR